MKPVVIIPTYNEALNISSLIKEIKNICNCAIIVVDDNSKDGTAQKVLEFKDVQLLKRSAKLGLASAYKDGFNYAIKLGHDTFIQMDADFSHNPKYLPVMLEKLKNYDMVIGSRNIKDGGVKNWTLLRKLISKGGSIYSRIILNCPIKDLTGGFNGYSLKALELIGIDNIISKGYSYQIEMKYKAYKKGVSFVEFPIIFEDRKFGQSKMSGSIFIEAFLNVIKLRFCK